MSSDPNNQWKAGSMDMQFLVGIEFEFHNSLLPMFLCSMNFFNGGKSR